MERNVLIAVDSSKSLSYMYVRQDKHISANRRWKCQLLLEKEMIRFFSITNNLQLRGIENIGVRNLDKSWIRDLLQVDYYS